MNEGALWFLFWGILAVIVVLVLARVRVRAIGELRTILYEDKNPELYLRVLENKRLRLIFSRRTLESLRGEVRRAGGVKGPKRKDT